MFYKLVTSCLENCRRLELALTHRPLHNAIGATRETSLFFFESLNMHFFLSVHRNSRLREWWEILELFCSFFI